MNLKTKLRVFSIIWVVMFCSACGQLNPAVVVDNVITIFAGLLPLVTAVASFVLPEDLKAIEAGAQLVQAGLEVVKNLVNDYHKNPSDGKLAAVQAAMTDVQNNLADLESAARIKDVATQRKVAAIIKATSLSLAALESTLIAEHPKAMAAAASESS